MPVPDNPNVPKNKIIWLEAGSLYYLLFEKEMKTMAIYTF